MQKLFFDFFPIILFFIAFKFFGIYAATAAAMAATGFQVAWSWLKHRKVGTTLWANLVIITLLGGITLLLHDETFVKWKPTAVYWFFTLALVGSSLFLKKNLIRTLLGAQIELPDAAWSILNVYWAVCFFVMGFINVAVAFLLGFSTETWVNFKLFGGLGMMFVFALLQGVLISKYLPENKDG
ncbi:MAG: septation protein A [Candidatus Accumulibacter sp.]|jgi:intracellular septation protein|nr:septation protein A [Accumulibacter sp.]